MSTKDSTGVETSGTTAASTPNWDGPFVERDRHGRPTGHHYVRCSDCGAEVLTGATEHASHRPGCSA